VPIRCRVPIPDQPGDSHENNPDPNRNLKEPEPLPEEHLPQHQRGKEYEHDDPLFAVHFSATHDFLTFLVRCAAAAERPRSLARRH
jgi:hypothetical protein